MNHLSLFSGIGGLDLAAEWAGMTTVAFCERDKFCQKVLAKHWPNTPIFDDIHTLTAAALRERGIDRIDIISGGFPCQPYSLAGERRGNEDDRALWPQMLRVIKECRPRWIVGENVAGVIDLALDGILASLEAESYSARAIVFPAHAIGAKHMRQRVFIIANSNRNGLEAKSNHGQIRNEAAYTRDSRQLKPMGREELRMWPSQSLPEPTICRELNGVSGGMARNRQLKAAGNAVVPQQAYPIFASIAQIEGRETCPE